MNRTINIDLLRLVLLESENIDEDFGAPIKIDGYRDDEVNAVAEMLEKYALINLFDDAVIFEEGHEDAEYRVLIQSITNDGLKFLNAIRTAEKLERIKDEAAEANITDVNSFVDFVLSK